MEVITSDNITILRIYVFLKIYFTRIFNLLDEKRSERNDYDDDDDE
jgi:hypothetical protein